MKVHVVLWKWVQDRFRETYTAEHVNIVSRMVRNYTDGMDVRIICVTDKPQDIDPPTEIFPLWKDHESLPNATGMHLPSCYRRLRLFDAETQRAMGIGEGERIVSLDLDSIIVGQLHDVFAAMDKDNSVFAGWGVRGTYHETVFNGSFWSFRAGNHLQKVWSTFDPAKSPRDTLAKGFLGSDQSWLSMNFAKRKDVCSIRYPMFASYPREVRRTGVLPKTTRIVFFHGARKPWHPMESKVQPWIHKHWRNVP